MFKWFVLFLSIYFLITAPASGETLELMEMETQDVIIKYEEPLKSVVSDVAGAYPDIRSSLERRLRLDVSFKPTVILLNTDSIFLSMVNGNRLVTAFARPQNNIIVIDYSKMLKTPFDLELTLKHELSHLVLGHHIRRELLPKWLNEGVSQWVSEGVADIINPDGNRILKQAVLSGNYLALRDISIRFPRSGDLFILSYEESKSIVEYIDSTYGTESLLNILGELREGKDIEEAVSASLPEDLNELERSWYRHIRKKYTWARFISDNIYWLIFFIGAMITVIGYLHLRRRMKTHFDEDDESTDSWNDHEP
jgi:hypothetical protein